MAEFQIIEREGLRQVKVILRNETVRTESSAMYYMRGNISIKSKTPSFWSLLKSLATSETIFRPTYTGTGELYLEPSFSSYHILQLNMDEWILERGAYLASDSNVEIDVHRDKTLTSLRSGKGLINFQTLVRGTGKVVIVAQGAVEVVNLQNDKLVVDGNFAVARTINLKYRIEKATKSIIGSITSGESLVSTFQGTGIVLLAPFPHWQILMLRRFANIGSNSSSR